MAQNTKTYFLIYFDEGNDLCTEELNYSDLEKWLQNEGDKYKFLDADHFLGIEDIRSEQAVVLEGRIVTPKLKRKIVEYELE